METKVTKQRWQKVEMTSAAGMSSEDGLGRKQGGRIRDTFAGIVKVKKSRQSEH